jgi:hypothetical protein
LNRLLSTNAAKQYLGIKNEAFLKKEIKCNPEIRSLGSKLFYDEKTTIPLLPLPAFLASGHSPNR